MVQKVKATILKYGMLSHSSDVTVALSGGADSVCLLYALYNLREELGISLSAFHLNHCLRGEESDRDESFVRGLCERLRVPLVVERIDISAEAQKRGESIELCARNIRYELYEKYASGVVAVAHTESDNLETVVYNLARGSAIKGLGGIPPVRGKIIRPLIECTRDEVEAWLQKEKFPFVTDSSNLTDDYTRNYIRHNIVPKLKSLNASVEQTVSANCESIREDADFLVGMATKIYCIIAKENSLDAELLSEQHPAVAKRVLAMLFKEVSGQSADNLHTGRMYDALLFGRKVSLPQGFYAERVGKDFVIAKEGETPTQSVYETEIVYNNGNVYNLLLKNTIDCDRIEGSLVVRTRNEGDSITLAGRKCTKTLKKLFNELKIPHCDRDSLPVAADDKGVVWIHSVGVAERVAVGKDTEKTLSFNVKKVR